MTDDKYKFTGDIDKITLKEGNPLEAYLQDGTKLTSKDMGEYYAYSDGNNLWRVPKQKPKIDPAKDIDKVILGTMALGISPLATPELFGSLVTSIAQNPQLWGQALQRTAAGMAGYEGVNELNKAINGETWGEGVHRLTNGKIPVWVGDLTNPGGALEGVITNAGNKIISNIIPLRSWNKVKNPLQFSQKPVLSFNVFQQINPKVNPLYARLSRMQEKIKNGVIPETKQEMLFDATPEKVKEAVLKIDPSMSGSEVQKAVDIALSKGYGVHIPIGNDIENIGGLSIADRKQAAQFLQSMGIEPTPRNIDMIMGHEVGHQAYEIPEEAKSLLYNYTRPEEFFTQAGQILDNAGIKNTLNNPVSYENFMNMLAQYQKQGNIDNGISQLAKFMESFKINTGNKWKDAVNVLNRNKLMKYINSLSAGLYGAYLINNE